jgi:hypothetical protein
MPGGFAQVEKPACQHLVENALRRVPFEWDGDDFSADDPAIHQGPAQSVREDFGASVDKRYLTVAIRIRNPCAFAIRFCGETWPRSGLPTDYGVILRSVKAFVEPGGHVSSRARVQVLYLRPRVQLQNLDARETPRSARNRPSNGGMGWRCVGSR